MELDGGNKKLGQVRQNWTKKNQTEFQLDLDSALRLKQQLHPMEAISKHFWIRSRYPPPRKEKREIDQVKAAAWTKLILWHWTRGRIYPMWFCCSGLGQSLCFTLKFFVRLVFPFGTMLFFLFFFLDWKFDGVCQIKAGLYMFEYEVLLGSANTSGFFFLFIFFSI